MVIYIVKMGVWNSSQTMLNSFQTSTLMQKTYISYSSETLPACIGSCLRTQVHACVHRPRVSFGLYFPKIDFLLIKKLYFPF